MTPDERLELDAQRLVNLWARTFTILKQKSTNIDNDRLLDVATALAAAEIRRNGAHSA